MSDVRSITTRVECVLKAVMSRDSKRKVCLALSFDGSKTPQKLQLSTAHKALVGAVAPMHMIDVREKSEDEVKAYFAKDSGLTLASEVKVAVMTIQAPGDGLSPYVVVAAQPQSLNAVTDFNQNVTNVILDYCKRTNGVASLASVAADGVGCDAAWIKGELVRFLEGKQSHVALVDPNHNGKNLRYLIIGGSCVVVLGNHVIDPEMLRLAGIPMEIWRVKDWASDRVVLELCSLNTGMFTISVCFNSV